MENQTKTVVHEFLTAIQQGNLEKLETLIHPEVTWIQAGNKPHFRNKKRQVQQFFRW